jgi:signal transduction histidine kinase
LQVLELVLVGIGALAHIHIVLARSSSARTLWFNPALYAWSLSWSIWYASVFTSLNLETISYDRFPWISMGLDLLKGTLLNLQCAFLLHGLSRWTGIARRVPAWAWYAPPALLMAFGGYLVAAHPMRGFLQNVEPVTRIFLALDIATCIAAVWMLSWAMPRFDRSQRSVARPLRKALVAMIPLLGAALALKVVFGFSGPGRFDWVLLHDLAHLLPPSALLWAAYRTESVALEVTRSSVRRVRAFGTVFVVYLALKFAFPLSEPDRVATWFMAGLGFLGTLGPMSLSLGIALSRWLDWGMLGEARLLSRLETRLWKPSLPEESVLAFAARGIGSILKCRWKILPGSDEQVEAVLAARKPPSSDGQFGAIAMFQATSRSEIPAWEALSARVLVPVRSPSGLQTLVLGATPKADRLPVAVLERLGAVQATCERVLDARHRLREGLESQRRLQESERLAMLGLMAASAAHEIKNPLSAIRNVASAALRDAPEGSVLRQDLSIVASEVDRLDETVRRMLLFARDRDSCEDAGETVRVVAGLLSVEARHRGVSLAVRGSEAPFAMPLSENDLKAILFNLVQNALVHAPTGTEVAIALCPPGPWLEVANESEIPADFRPRLFQPLASRGGNGLGLYISRSKAEASGGRLEYLPVAGRTVFRLTWENPEMSDSASPGIRRKKKDPP